MEALRERFGKYHVLGKLAQGGMAEVYKVKTIGIAGFEKVQALKRILPGSAHQDRFIRSFIDEARIAVELTHRNIVQVFDFGKADGELYMAMELIEGKDLRTAMTQAVARDLFPEVAIAAYIVSEVAQGLDYAHRKTDGYGSSLGIVHCDVSPSNVMLSMDGYVKILDFGIARARFASALERRRLRGKPRYMAPEQTIGEPPTAASDVFALGIIAWELFTGLPLYRGPDLKSILEAVRRTVPPPIERHNPTVPAEVTRAVARALAREPEARGTAADLAAACARTAMAAGARQLAGWLAELETRPSVTATLLQSGAASVSVSKPSLDPSARSESDSASLPPSRPSRTASLANVPAPVADFGAGTPAFDDDVELPTHRQRNTPYPAAGAPGVPGTTEPFERAATAVHPRFDVTGSAAPVREPTVILRDEAPRWDRTATGIAKLADALPVDRAAHDPVIPPPAWGATEPVPRPSYTTIAGPPVRPSQLVVDEDATFHGIEAPPVAPDDTSYDEIEAELDDEPAAAASASGAWAGEQAIDDELGAPSGAAWVGAWGGPERRRTVVVAGVLAGAPADELRPVTRMLGELAYRRGGVVVALDDDALVVAFGLEVAGEDDVAVAMGWALDATAMARDAAEGGAIVLRAGGRTGVLTTAEADGTHVPQDAIDEARRLARTAVPERPLFVSGSGRLTTVEPHGEDPARLAAARRGKFVGRTVQLQELELWLSRAVAADRRQTVLIQGAPGTGKSRLVAELVARKRAADPPLRIVTTAAAPGSRLAPFSTVIDLYQAALELPPTRGRAARRQLVERLLHLLGRGGVSTPRARAVASDLERAMELRDGVGLGAPEVADLRPRIAAGLAAFRMAMTDRRRPLLTVIEDVHLADSASSEVLRHMLALPAHGPELLVLTARPEGLAPPPVDSTITVGDLVGGELRALIADRLGSAATPFNIAAVLARGGGNPLFVEELAQAVRDAEGGDEDVPATARDVVLARLERLSPGARAAVRYAAVLGATVRPRLLEELLGTDVEVPSREPELDELLAAGFLVRAEGGELEFARGLVREVVYESLSARAQRDSHARVGRLLASRFFAGREEPPAVIAEHLERGGELAGAAAFWLRAGRLALAASDTGAAIACFSRTLNLDRELGATPPTATSRARRREALAGREEAHRLEGDLVTNAGDLDELHRLCEGEPARLADVALRRAQRLLRLGDFAGAQVATVVAEDHAAAAAPGPGGDARLRGEAFRVRAEILERLGRFDEALALVDAARDVFHRQRLVHDEMAARIGRGRILLLRAEYEAARAAYQPVLALIEKTGDPWLERIATNHVAVIELCLGHFTQAMRSAQRSLELCRRYGDRAREGDALTVLGIILAESGRYEEAAAMFTEALETLERSSSRWGRADCLIYAGACDARRGLASGLAMLDEAVAEARRIGARYLEANALVARAGAHLQRGAYGEAIQDAADGTAVAYAAGLVGYQIQGLARHALALARSGTRPLEAGALVHRALGLLEQQRFVEGSEEEVYAACAEVLARTGAASAAAQVRDRGRRSAQRKLAGLVDPAWRAAYAAIPEVARLLA